MISFHILGPSKLDKGCANKNDKDEMVKLAKIAKHQKRFEDMVECMKKAAEVEGKLNKAERELLRDAYIHIINREMTKWRNDKSSNKDTSRVNNILHEAFA